MVITNPDYSLFCDNTAYLASLAFHDPKYLTPIAIILLNFIILKKSRHPLFINLNHPGNVMHCFNIAFMSGLLFVPVPGIYHFAYMGLALGHIMLRSLRYAREDMFRSVKKIFK